MPAVACSHGFCFYIMGTITALTAQVKNPDRVNVFIDGTFALGLAMSVAAGLRTGQEISRSELEKLDLRYNPHWVQFLQLPDVEPGILAGYHAMQAMLAGGTLPTAILATNDLVAMGVIEALKLAGIAVPGDISVIGYDDLGRDQNPPLTTIGSYPEEVGRRAARILMEQLDGDPAPSRVAVPTELLVRGSTAPPRAS